MVPSSIAVECFYMISGFYMALILNEKYVLKGDYPIFLQQRFFRLYPTYFTVFFLYLVYEAISHIPQGASNPYYGSPSWHDLNPLSTVILAAVNLFIVGQDWMMFLGVGAHGELYFTAHFWTEHLPAWRFLVVPQAWSLGVEVTFYLLAPFLLRRSLILQISLIMASLALRFSLKYFFGLFHDPWSYRFFPFELAFFLLGSVAYRIYASRRVLYAQAASRLGWLRWPLLLAFLNYLAIFGSHGKGSLIFFAFCFLLIPLFFLATKTSALDKLLGELSYPLYLSHALALAVLHRWAVDLPSWYQGFFYSSGAIVLAYPICRWVDYPVERFRHGLLPKRQQQPPPGCK
jgi:peptidoglycan/LPS O-acetylase OafA/YrhL